MARIFRQRYTKPTPDGGKVTKISRKWYVEYRDAQSIRRRVPGYTDKPATQQLASDLERQAAREQSGLVDRFTEHRKRPLPEHLVDWRLGLLAKGTTEKHANLVSRRVGRVLSDCRFIYWPDLSASKVQAYLAELRDGDASIQTSNFYLQAAKQFCRWMVRDGRASDNPLQHLQGGNVRTDRRHDRRALTDDELLTLLDVTQNGPMCFGMTGPDRAMLYQLAVETGLRASELRSLTWRSIDLDGGPPTVTVAAAYSKRRRDDTLPLKASTAQILACWRDESDRADPEHPVFATMPDKGVIAKMLRADLTNAGIAYRDDAGHVADFHALRHTFITNLARGGVHPKVAQQLARHSTITLTMDRYSHTVVGELSEALDALPELSPGMSERERQRATGTCDIAPKSLPPGLPKSLPTRAALKPSPVASHCTTPANEADLSHQEDSTEQVVSCTSVHPSAPHCTSNGEGGIRTRDTGANPYDGLANRWFQPLTHLSKPL